MSYTKTLPFGSSRCASFINVINNLMIPESVFQLYILYRERSRPIVFVETPQHSFKHPYRTLQWFFVKPIHISHVTDTYQQIYVILNQGQNILNKMSKKIQEKNEKSWNVCFLRGYLSHFVCIHCFVLCKSNVLSMSVFS